MMIVTLAVIFLFAGSGLVVVHCNHSGNTKVVSFHDSCGKKCKTTSSCMTVKVLKFSDMTQSVTPDFHHHLQIITLPWLMQPLYEAIEFIIDSSDSMLHNGSYICGPPREYLSLLCVLLI